MEAELKLVRAERDEALRRLDLMRAERDIEQQQYALARVSQSASLPTDMVAADLTEFAAAMQTCCAPLSALLDDTGPAARRPASRPLWDKNDRDETAARIETLERDVIVIKPATRAASPEGIPS